MSKPVKALPLQISNQRSISSTRSHFSTHSIGDLHACAWLGIIENHAVSLLSRMSFINRCIRGICHTESKTVSLHFHPMAIITSLPKVVSLLEKVVLNKAYAKVSGNRIVYPSLGVCSKTVQRCTQCLLMVTSYCWAIIDGVPQRCD